MPWLLQSPRCLVQDDKLEVLLKKPAFKYNRYCYTYLQPGFKVCGGFMNALYSHIYNKFTFCLNKALSFKISSYIVI